MLKANSVPAFHATRRVKYGEIIGIVGGAENVTAR
jgi:hypothetical protein